jgi:hypothetical protein
MADGIACERCACREPSLHPQLRRKKTLGAKRQGASQQGAEGEEALALSHISLSHWYGRATDHIYMYVSG